MSEEIFNFDKIEQEAKDAKKQEEKQTAEKKAKESKPFANWTKGPIIIGAIAAVIIIAAPLIFLYCF